MKAALLVFSLLAGFAANAANYQDTDSLTLAQLESIISRMQLKNSIGLRYGTPSEPQVVPINTKELYYQHSFHPIPGTLMIPMLETSISQLNVGEKSGYVWGVGPAASVPISGTGGHLFLVGHGKVHYLTRTEYDHKDYGGPVQWTYGFGLKSKISVNTFASYMWQHMSNADRYSVNPALETHTMTVGVYF